MKRFAILTICLIIGIYTDAQEWFKTISEIKATSAKIDGVYIPRDVDDAINVLDTLLTSGQKDTLRSLSYSDYTSGLHHGLGRALRNDWGLWDGSRLCSYFTSSGMYHPDDMSSYILLAFYHHLHGTERPKIEDTKLSGEGGKMTIFSRYWRENRARNAKAIREIKDEGYRKGVEVYYEYPYGFSTENEENIYNRADSPEMKAKGVIKEFDKKNGWIVVEITHTPEPYGIIVYDGNQACYEDTCRDYSTFSTETPNIFLLEKGEEMRFTVKEFYDYWY